MPCCTHDWRPWRASPPRPAPPNQADKDGGFPPAHLWTPPAIAGAGGAHRMDSGTLTGTVDSPRTAAGSFVAHVRGGTGLTTAPPMPAT